MIGASLGATGARLLLTILGEVAEEGVCGERVDPDRDWTIRVRLRSWAEPGCTPSSEPLDITLRGSLGELCELQRKWPPGARVRAQVQFGDEPSKATLVRSLP